MIDFERKDMATIEAVKEVINHPNADRLDIVTINDWQCVTQKDAFSKGDLCVYFCIDCILPLEIERKIFGEDSNVKLKNSRVRTIKLRKAVSQGMAVPLNVMFSESKCGKLNKGDDVTKKLGIGKYVPEPKKGSVLYTGSIRSAVAGNENFKKMRKPAHLKSVGGFEGKLVMITEKIHGTSFVAGWVERENRTLMQRLNKTIFGKYQFCWRSMNRQLQGNDSLYSNILRKFGFKKEDPMATIYGRMCAKYNLKDKLGNGEEVVGEIYGSGIQDGYDYGMKSGEQALVCFGFREDGVETTPEVVKTMLSRKSLPMVPILYTGMYYKDTVDECTVGKSILDPNTKIREGCCVVTMSGQNSWHGKCIVKNINPAYLLKNQTEFN